jgi:diguanylate cyclase (GGDEF)-like protein
MTSRVATSQPVTARAVPEDVRQHRAAQTDPPLPDDDLERRRRRGIEWYAIGSRAVAAGWVVSAGLLRPSAVLAGRLGVSGHLLSLYLALPQLAAVAFGVLVLHHVGSRPYRLLSLASLAIDTLIVVAVVAMVSADRSVVVWPVLVIPVMLGAIRHGLPGALGAWMFTAVASVTLYATSDTLYGFQLDPPILYTGVGLGVTVAVLTGLQARGQHRHHRELTAVRAALRHQTLHDPLTGLANRTLLDERLRTLLGTGDPVTVLALDLDGFKTVNDTFGHAAGDELLQVVAGRLRAQADDGDLVARLGGDEFVVVLADTTEADAREIAEELRHALVTPIALDGNSARIDASVGVARAAGTDPGSLLRAADADMYRVKHVRREAQRAEHAAAGRPGSAFRSANCVGTDGDPPHAPLAPRRTGGHNDPAGTTIRPHAGGHSS